MSNNQEGDANDSLCAVKRGEIKSPGQGGGSKRWGKFRQIGDESRWGGVGATIWGWGGGLEKARGWPVTHTAPFPIIWKDIGVVRRHSHYRGVFLSSYMNKNSDQSTRYGKKHDEIMFAFLNNGSVKKPQKLSTLKYL